MPRETTIELYKEQMKFSAGHFTIFSKTERERLHGHNFAVYAAITTLVGDDGLAFDYAIYKKEIIRLCKEWNEYFLLPENSPHLTIRKVDGRVEVGFNGQTIPFLEQDVLLLPIANVTLEELSSLFLEKLVNFGRENQHTMISRLTVKVFTGPGQNTSSTWTAN